MLVFCSQLVVKSAALTDEMLLLLFGPSVPPAEKSLTLRCNRLAAFGRLAS